MTLLARPRFDPRSLPPQRDGAMDLVRALCLVVVVALHGFMAGIGMSDGAPPHTPGSLAHAPDGAIVVTNVVEGQAWFAPVSWVVQVMPLFFIVGGFAAMTQWRRMRGRGVSAPEFVRRRMLRLTVPALAAFAAVGLGLAIALMAGVAPELVGELGFRMAQPMWFLAVYIGATALVPILTGWHERAPWSTLGLLVLGVVAVDVLRTVTGIDGLGYLNLGFVWLAIQQLGLWWADGRVETLSRPALVAGLAGALSLLVALTASGIYSPDMYENLNPPTLALVVLGAAQMFGLALAAPALRRFAARPRVASVIGVIGRRSMTIYLWHMPAVVLLAGALFAAGVDFPEPLSPRWWMTRLAWLGAIGIATALLVRATGWFEDRAPGADVGVGGVQVAAAAVIAIAGVVGVLVVGFTPLSAGVAVAAFAGAARLVSSPARGVALSPLPA